MLPVQDFDPRDHALIAVVVVLNSLLPVMPYLGFQVWHSLCFGLHLLDGVDLRVAWVEFEIDSPPLQPAYLLLLPLHCSHHDLIERPPFHPGYLLFLLHRSHCRVMERPPFGYLFPFLLPLVSIVTVRQMKTLPQIFSFIANLCLKLETYGDDVILPEEQPITSYTNRTGSTVVRTEQEVIPCRTNTVLLHTLCL